MSQALAQLVARANKVARKKLGNDVTLANGTKLRAEYLTEMREIQKYVVLDGEQQGRGKVVVVFVFDGSAYGLIQGGDPFTFMGDTYRAETPIYPRFKDNVCTELAVASFLP